MNNYFFVKVWNTLVLTIDIIYFQSSCPEYDEVFGQKKVDYIALVYKYAPVRFWLKNLEK